MDKIENLDDFLSDWEVSHGSLGPANPYQGELIDRKGRIIKKYHQRNRLWFWTLTPVRLGVKAPYYALDVDKELGPPRDLEANGQDNIWMADHPTGGLFSLGDEKWYLLLFFRLSDIAVNRGDASHPSEAGLWGDRIIEIESNLNEAILPWQF